MGKTSVVLSPLQDSQYRQDPLFATRQLRPQIGVELPDRPGKFYEGTGRGNGMPGRIRTFDRPIKSRMLYQLSYGHSKRVGQ